MKNNRNKKMKSIKASVVRMSEDDFRTALEETLTSELCKDIVEDDWDRFYEIIFEDLESFCNERGENPWEVLRSFWYGEDLDTESDPANPMREYARFNSYGNVETTDYPEDIYYSNHLDEIIDYIVEKVEYKEFPDEIQEIIDQYLNFGDMED